MQTREKGRGSEDMQCFGFCTKTKKKTAGQKYDLPLPVELTKLVLSFTGVKDLRVLSIIGNHRRHRNSLASHAKREYAKRFANDTAAHFIVCLDPLQRWPSCVQIRRNLKDEVALRDFKTDFTCHHVEDIRPGQNVGHIKAKLLGQHERACVPCKNNIAYRNQLVHDSKGTGKLDSLIHSLSVGRTSSLSEPCFLCCSMERQSDFVVVHISGILKQYEAQSYLRLSQTMYETLSATKTHTLYDMALARCNMFFTEECNHLFAFRSGGSTECFQAMTQRIPSKLTYMINNGYFHAVLLCPRCAFFRLSPEHRSISERAIDFFHAWEVNDNEALSSIILMKANMAMKKRLKARGQGC